MRKKTKKLLTKILIGTSVLIGGALLLGGIKKDTTNKEKPNITNKMKDDENLFI